MEYHNQKAKYAYELFLKELPFKKVYAAVRKDDKYVVLKNAEGKKWKYQLSGGGVEPCEDHITAIKREVLEELNMHVKVIKSLGVIHYESPWKYDGKEFNVKYEAEIFLTEFISHASHNKFGLDGEFSADIGVTGIAEISEEEMLANVSEFSQDKVKLN